jgi:hypothetical protein
MKHYISLGMNCDVATWIRDSGKRTVAFPFDWAVTPMSAALFHLETRFEHFMLPENLVANEPAMRKLLVDETKGEYLPGMTTPTFCKKTGSFYPHDFNETGVDEQIDEVRAKYSRRILRMFDLFDDPKNRFIFVANDCNLHPFQAEQYAVAGINFSNRLQFLDWETRLRKVMESTYPHVKFDCFNLNEIKRLYP